MHELKILLHEPEFQNCKIILILNEVEPYYTFGNKPTGVAARTEEEDFKQRKEKFMERLNFDFLLGNLKKNDFDLYPIDLSKIEELDILKKRLRHTFENLKKD